MTNETKSQEDESCTMTSIETLAQQIMARIEAGDKALARAREQREAATTAQQQADDRFLSAGGLLIEARDRLTGRQAFKMFLRQHCAGLCQSRAYEYIAMAEGRTTPDEIRAEANKRKRRHRAKRRAGGMPSGFRSTVQGTENAAEEAGAARRRAEADGGEASRASTTAGAHKEEYAQYDASTGEMVSEAPAAETPLDALAKAKLAIDRYFPMMDDAGRREIAAYAAAWSPLDIPDFLKRAA